MRIAVIGRGTSSIVQILHLLDLRCNIDVFYDPDVPVINVGESSTPLLLDLIYHRTGITSGMLYEEGIASYKLGVKFINWSKGNTFKHNFGFKEHAIHFETRKFNTYFEKVLTDLGVNYIPKRVNEHKVLENSVLINDTHYDFVVFCTGWYDNDDMSPVPFETVNSAILYKKDWVDKEEPFYTLHTATPHGWEFGLPFPKQGITKFGYLFNNKIDNKDQLFDYLSKDPLKQDLKAISWTPKYSDKLIPTPFTAYCGNRLFFSEPLQALSLLYYNVFATKIAEYLKNRSEAFRHTINIQYNSVLEQSFYALIFHYQFGSVFNSPFWENMSTKIKQFKMTNIKFNIDNLKQGFLSEYNAYKERGDFIPFDFENVGTSNKVIKLGPFEWLDFKELYQGFSGENIF